MNPIKQYIEELCEGSYAESDIPDKFYLVIRKLDDDVCKNLVNHELRGVKGVSASRNILPAWLDVRDVAIEMDGKEFERLNKLSKIGYDNPDYLVSSNFAAIRRIKSDNPDKPIDVYGFISVIEQIAREIDEIGIRTPEAQWLRAIFTTYGTSEKTGKHYGLNGLVKAEGLPRINSVNGLVNWIWSNRHKLSQTNPYRAVSPDPHSQDGLNVSYVDKIIRLALTHFGSHYRERESEWILKKEWIEGGENRILRIPNNSRLLIKREKFEGEPPVFAGHHQYNEMYVEEYGLEKLYRITWVDRRKYAVAAKQQSQNFWKGKLDDKKQWRDDVRKAHEKEIQRDAKIKQLAAARDAKKAKLAQQKQAQSIIASESFWLDGLDLSEATLYHGSPFPNIVECESGICLAYEEDIAKEYAGTSHDENGFSGDRKRNPDASSYSETVYVVDVSDEIRIASTADLENAFVQYYRGSFNDMEQFTDEEILGWVSNKFHMADEPETREILVRKGFDAIEYEDDSPSYARHQTLRILNPAVVKIIGRKQVK